MIAAAEALSTAKRLEAQHNFRKDRSWSAKTRATGTTTTKS